MKIGTVRNCDPGSRIFLLSFLAPLALFVAGCAGNKVSVSPHQNPGPYRIAVIPFESSNPFLSGHVFSDCFTVRILRDIPDLQVIERKDLMKILQEQKLTLTGIIRQEKFMKLGSILGVDSILIGSVHTLETLQGEGGTILVTVKLMDVQTGKVIWADRRRINHAGWSVLEVPEVADILIEKAAKIMVKKMEGALKPGSFASYRPADDSAVFESKLTSLRPR
jgi:TolB-like protein